MLLTILQARNASEPSCPLNTVEPAAAPSAMSHHHVHGLTPGHHAAPGDGEVVVRTNCFDIK